MKEFKPDTHPIKITCDVSETLPLDDIIDFQGVLKTLSTANRDKIVASICQEGFMVPFFIWNDGGQFKPLDGHQRRTTLLWMRAHGWEIPSLPVVYIQAANEEEARRKLLKITSQYGEFNFEELERWIEQAGEEIEKSVRLVDTELEFAFEQMAGPGEGEGVSGNLTTKFLVPPFSILDTRQGYWQDRKRWWNAKIGDNGETREETLGDSKSSYSSFSRNGQGQAGNNDMAPNVSILDPVLAEIAVKWFGLPGGRSFDCFSGDSVFGYVSSYEGLPFTGIELRQEQADLNQQRIGSFPESRYICDDGQNVLQHIPEESQDLLFSCPPYYDLEVYSDRPDDASNQGTYEEFLLILENAFTDAVRCLRDNRFAFIVVGDVRNKKDGGYYRFPDDIKRIFTAAGMILYNELVLIEQSGTAALRAAKIMKHRKVVKTHQNVLIFYKGDQKKIKEIFPEVEVEYESEDVD